MNEILSSIKAGDGARANRSIKLPNRSFPRYNRSISPANRSFPPAKRSIPTPNRSFLPANRSIPPPAAAIPASYIQNARDHFALPGGKPRLNGGLRFASPFLLGTRGKGCHFKSADLAALYTNRSRCLGNAQAHPANAQANAPTAQATARTAQATTPKTHPRRSNPTNRRNPAR